MASCSNGCQVARPPAPEFPAHPAPENTPPSNNSTTTASPTTGRSKATPARSAARVMPPSPPLPITSRTAAAPRPRAGTGSTTPSSAPLETPPPPWSRPSSTAQPDCHVPGDDSHGCYFCPRLDFPTLSQLNHHLESPKHSKRTSGMYTCPQCRARTQTLSGLIQHAEMGGCGVSRDARVQGALEGLTQGMKQLGW